MEVLIGAGCLLIGLLIGFFSGLKIMLIKCKEDENEKIQLEITRKNRFYGDFKIMQNFLKMRQENKDITEFFTNRGIKNIAIYGYGVNAKTFLKEIENSNIEIDYIIDKNFVDTGGKFKTVLPFSSFEKTDAIVVTPVFDFDNIEAYLSEKTDIPIISLEEIF